MCIWTAIAWKVVFKGTGLWGKSFEIRRATPPVALSEEWKSFLKVL